MEFSWSEAGRIALMGFAGVFLILIILAIALYLISRLANRFSPKEVEKKEEAK